MQQANASKRLAIYFFYDKDGIADNYIDYFLNGLKEVAGKVVVVCNGALTPKSHAMFEKYSQDIIVRENFGLDVWAYKTALEYVGWEKLRTYYEVLLVNFTIMGPVYPFSEMFNKMDRRTELDFWGVNVWCPDSFPDGVASNWCGNPYGYVPEHIQSYFMVYRQKFTKEPDLEEYWNNIPAIETYTQSVGNHESYFTHYFSEKGFQYAAYVDNREEREYGTYYLIDNPVRAIKEDLCPIFKRKSFFYDYKEYLIYNIAQQVPMLMEYLKNKTDYPVDLIWENILRTQHQIDFVQDLNLNYILPPSDVPVKPQSTARVALVGHLYYMDLLGRSFHYISSMPANADIYLTVSKPEWKEIVEEYFGRLPNKVEVRLIENRGRDVSALLVGTADVAHNYDYVCFYHDKKVTQIKPYQIGRTFAYCVNESVLHSPAYVLNIISTFEQNSRLGLLMPFPPTHSDWYYLMLGNEWGDDYDNVVDLAHKLNLNVPMQKEKPPVAPLGTVFWFRAKALLPLFDYGWKYSDFPEEPTEKVDGTILHAIERIYPFVTQNSGFYPAYVMPEFMAGLELTQLRSYVRNFNATFIKHDIRTSHRGCVQYLDDLFEAKKVMEERIEQLSKCDPLPKQPDPLPKRLKLKLKCFLPRWLYLGILKLKRMIFGPWDKKATYDEE